jgi:hypothetical protein
MAYDLNAIYDRTSGYCHICQPKVYFSNYGIVGAREHGRLNTPGH